MLLNNKHYYNLPPQERKDLWKHYKKVYPNMGYTDMVKHFNGEVENYQFGGRTDYFDSDVKKFADGGKIKKLDPLEEKEFLKEYSKYSKLTGMSPNPDDPEHYYDYRGLWKDTGTILYNLDKDQHLPSKYKTLGHPNKYIQGTDTTKEKYADGGKTDKYVAEPSTTATRFRRDKPIFRSESPRESEPVFNANNWILQHIEPFSSIKDAYGIYDAVKRGDKADLNKSIFSQIIPFLNYSDIKLPGEVKKAVNRTEQENKDIILKRIKKAKQ